jgi:HNH endonuclease
VSPREPISKKTRFEILKRDKFTCQYCGKRAPDVLLVIDHVEPVVKGGKSTLLNLTTSCESCNQGKGPRQLSDDSAMHVQLAELDRLQARREQLQELVRWRKSLEKIGDMEFRSVEAAIRRRRVTLNPCGKEILRRLVAKYGTAECLEAVHIAFLTYYSEAKPDSANVAFNKIPGILFNRRAEARDPLLPTLNKMSWYLDRFVHHPRWKTVERLRELFDCGYTEDAIWDLVRNSRSTTQFFSNSHIMRETRP